MLTRPGTTGIFNAGFENLAIQEIAKKIGGRLNVRTVAMPSNDPRSYRLSSSKLLAAGFKPKRTVDDAIHEIISAVREGKMEDSPRWYNLKAMPKSA